MKTGILCMMVCVLLSVFSPLTVTHEPSDTQTSLVTLDMCRVAGAALFTDDGSMPMINECPCGMYNPGFAGFYDASNCVFGPYILSFQTEKPPEI